MSIFHFNIYENEIDKQREKAPYIGEFLGHDNLYKIMRLYFGSPFVIYGFGGTGKTFLWFDFAINMSIHKQRKHFVWCPEMGNAEDVYYILIRMAAKKPINKLDSSGNENFNCCTDQEYQQAKEFISQYFYVHQPDINENASIRNIYDWKKEAEIKIGMRFNTILVDPFSYLRFDEGVGTIWDHVQRTLEQAKDHDKKNNTTTVIITHVSKPDRKVVNGKSVAAMPTKHMIHGGMAWEKSADNIMLVHKPDPELTGSQEDEIWLKSDKIRPYLAGKPGEITSIFQDSKTLRYSENGLFDRQNGSGEDAPF